MKRTRRAQVTTKQASTSRLTPTTGNLFSNSRWVTRNPGPQRWAGKEQQVRKQSAQRETDHGEQVNTPAPREQESAFNKAVKEAKRSILVFNLDMGQTPIMNPTTISAKVTLSMLNILAEKDGGWWLDFLFPFLYHILHFYTLLSAMYIYMGSFIVFC